MIGEGGLGQTAVEDVKGQSPRGTAKASLSQEKRAPLPSAGK
jgi:hypothetical protein